MVTAIIRYLADAEATIPTNVDDHEMDSDDNMKKDSLPYSHDIILVACITRLKGD